MKKRSSVVPALTAVLSLLLCSCTPAEKTSETFALDTICTQQVIGINADAAVSEVNENLTRITRELSMNEGSYVYAANHSAPEPAAVSDEAARLIAEALRYADETDGAFDPAIGAISTLWDITGSPRVPSDDEIADALPFTDYHNVTVSGNAVTIAKKGTLLDLGGIAKGYAADLAVQIYQKYGVGSAILNLGGNVCVYGKKTDGSDFRIGLRDPLGAENEYAAIISVSNTSVVTSGVYERFFESGGKTYHHLFDPKTGRPADNGLLAVTVVCESSAKADALSTALFVMGLEKGLVFAEHEDGVEAVFITDDRYVYVTSGLEDNIRITDEAYTLKS